MRHRSRDVADRAAGSDVVDALRGLGLPSRPVPEPWVPDVPAEPTDTAFRTTAFGQYFRRLAFGTTALATRMRDVADAAESRQASAMASSYLDAWARRREESG